MWGIYVMWFKAKQETVEKVSEIVKKQLSLSGDQKVTAGTKFTDLGADSLDTVSTKLLPSITSFYLKTHPSIMNKYCFDEMFLQVEIVMGLEEEFGITMAEERAKEIATVQQAAELIEELVQEKTT